MRKCELKRFDFLIKKEEASGGLASLCDVLFGDRLQLVLVLAEEDGGPDEDTRRNRSKSKRQGRFVACYSWGSRTEMESASQPLRWTT